MVFRTAINCAREYLYKGTPKLVLDNKCQSRLAKRYQFKRLGGKYQGRLRNCFVIGILKLHKAFTYATKGAAMKEDELNRLYETRVEAACLEHGMDKQYFYTSLGEFDINLNRESLSNLAIYEPRTFQTLVEFVKMRSLEIGLQSKPLGETSGLEMRGVIDKIKQSNSASS